MRKYPIGTICWAVDPTGAHEQRPVVILSHEKHPFSASDCTVMCIGTSAGDYDHYSPELKDKHLSGISFDETNYLMPWALHTIPPSGLITTRTGELTEDGEKLVKRALLSLFKV